MPEIMDTTNLWPLELGNTWIFRRSDAPEQETIIRVEPEDRFPGVCVHHMKNNDLTYWNPSGLDGPGKENMRWFVIPFSQMPGWEDELLWAWGDMRYDRITGQFNTGYHYMSVDPLKYPGYVLFRRHQPVPYRFTGEQKYFAVKDYNRFIKQDFYHLKDYQSRGTWELNFEWSEVSVPAYQGKVLRIKFDENWDIREPKKCWVHEDWYFADGVGPVLIEQYLSRERKELRIRIELEQVHLKKS